MLIKQRIPVNRIKSSDWNLPNKGRKPIKANGVCRDPGCKDRRSKMDKPCYLLSGSADGIRFTEVVCSGTFAAGIVEGC